MNTSAEEQLVAAQELQTRALELARGLLAAENTHGDATHPIFYKLKMSSLIR